MYCLSNYNCIQEINMLLLNKIKISESMYIKIFYTEYGRKDKHIIMSDIKQYNFIILLVYNFKVIEK